jgi:hypothetical protein
MKNLRVENLVTSSLEEIILKNSIVTLRKHSNCYNRGRKSGRGGKFWGREKPQKGREFRKK